MKKVLTILLAVLLLVTLCACGEKADLSEEENQDLLSDAGEELPEAEPLPQEDASEPVQEEQEPEPPQEPEPTGYYNPLTGEETETDISANRPVAVMLNTLKKALPQSGPADADILIEIPEEGGITRVMALYQDITGLGKLGSIRSTREYFVYLAMGFDAMIAHAGASYTATEELNHYGYKTLNYMSNGNLYWRDEARWEAVGKEHSLYTSGEVLSEYLAQTTKIRTVHGEGYEHPLQFTQDGTPQGGAPAHSIYVDFSNYKKTSFTYDAIAGKYMVFFFDGEPYMDENTDTQVAVTNVIVIPTNQRTKSDGQLQEFDLSSGTGYYACGGEYIEINWSKGGETAPLTFTNKDGTPLQLGVGTTYICILDSDRTYTFQ